MKLIHGDILFSKDTENFFVKENGYIAVEDGIVSAIYDSIPEELRNCEVEDFGRGLIIPAFADMHVHASQYVQRGLGMDLLLADWLSQYTFPQESRFKDMDYARPIYDRFVDDLIESGTLCSSVFTTVHRESAEYLASLMEKKGLYSYIGKVNMDCGCPDYIRESVADSVRETELFLDHLSSNRKTKAIIIPRFAPTCSPEHMPRLGELGKKYSVGLHTHLVESRWEAGEALRCFPGCASDAEIYERSGLLGNGPTIFAHYIFPTENTQSIVKKYGALTVHCPESTNNVIAGIMPAGALLDDGVKISLGSDVGGGSNLSIYRQIAFAIRISKLKDFYEPEANRVITLENAFHMATRAGGELFGKVGAFEPGYSFTALVIDGVEDRGIALSPEQRLERFCYCGDNSNIRARFIDGARI